MEEKSKEQPNELDMARAKIEEEKANRENQALKEIGEILNKYNCEMQAHPLISADGRIMARTVVASKV